LKRSNRLVLLIGVFLAVLAFVNQRSNEKGILADQMGRLESLKAAASKRLTAAMTGLVRCFVVNAVFRDDPAGRGILDTLGIDTTTTTNMTSPATIATRKRIAALRSRRIAAILASALSGSAFAQSLRPSYSPDGTSQSDRPVSLKKSVVHAPKPVARQFSGASRSEPVPASQAQSLAPQPVPQSPNPGIHDFFAAIFAGPIMLSHAFRPPESQYSGAPAGNSGQSGRRLR